MRFAVKNIKDTKHMICRFSGSKVILQPGEIQIFDTEDEKEFNYWNDLPDAKLQMYGLEVITDEAQIEKSSATHDTSIVDGFVSPIAREIAESTLKSEEQVIPSSTSSDNNEYTEESLSQMSKEELFAICDERGIKYKRNNSVKTLVGLILESGVV